MKPPRGRPASRLAPAGATAPAPRARPGSSAGTGPAEDDFTAAVLHVLGALGEGEVVTYGEVAAQAGRPGAARAVGTLLSRGEWDVAWWRVVTTTGRLVPGHEREHARRLRAEGVPVAYGHVVMDKRRR
jgi:methylated-DNA-protein-cysteine methyltransferase-like protein